LIRKTYIWVRLVDDGIEHFHGLPDAHAGMATALEVNASLDVEGNGWFSACSGVIKQSEMVLSE
jgi:hypothetical protein